MLAKKLFQLGLTVALIDKEKEFSKGPSTRNEGWLHRGTYHAVSIKDPDHAKRVASRCIHGHEQIKAYAPEACEEIHQPAFAFTLCAFDVAEIKSRWGSAGVKFQEVSFTELKRHVPELVLPNVVAAFRV
jgi:hypothetical protein